MAGYTKRQMDAVVEHMHAQLAYKGRPSLETASALLAARRKVARICGGGSGNANIIDGVKIRREHLSERGLTRRR
jgi:hypothetical protein